MKLHCHDCGKFMADVRDASLRNGLVVLCASCNEKRKQAAPHDPTKYDMPEFLQGLFGGRK